MHTQQIVSNLPIVPGGVHNMCPMQNSKSNGYVLSLHLKQGQKPDVNTCLIESNLVNRCNKAFKNSPPRSLCKTLGKPNNRKTSLNRALAAVVAVLSGTGIARK